MKTRNLLGIAALGAALVLGLGTLPAPALAGGGNPAIGVGQRLRLEARLRVAGSQLSSKAAYRSEPRGGGTRESLSVEVQGAQPGATFNVTIAGRKMGTITANALGRGKLELNAGGDNPNQTAPMNFQAGNPVVIGTMTGSFVVR